MSEDLLAKILLTPESRRSIEALAFCLFVDSVLGPNLDIEVIIDDTIESIKCDGFTMAISGNDMDQVLEGWKNLSDEKRTAYFRQTLDKIQEAIGEQNES